MWRVAGLALLCACNFGSAAVPADGPPDIAVDRPPDGPGRIVTSSINAVGHNFSVGQDGKNWAAQAQTSNVGIIDVNGDPVLTGGPMVAGTDTQVVLTVDGQNRKLYVDGMMVAMDALGG